MKISFAVIYSLINMYLDISHSIKVSSDNPLDLKDDSIKMSSDDPISNTIQIDGEIKPEIDDKNAVHMVK